MWEKTWGGGHSIVVYFYKIVCFTRNVILSKERARHLNTKNVEHITTLLCTPKKDVEHYTDEQILILKIFPSNYLIGILGHNVSLI